MKKKFLWLLSAGHLVTDMPQGGLPAILPFLIAAGGLTYADAAGLTFAIALSSSVIQPLFGIWADKKLIGWLIPAGVLAAGGCLALLGPLHGNYWLMFVAAIFSGLGVAAYHPEAARLANKLAGKKKGGGMSIFSVGGNVGFAAGPAIATPAMLIFGLSGSLIMAIPAIAMFIMFMVFSGQMREQVSVVQKEESLTSAPVMKNEWAMFVLLTVAVVSRSIIFHNLNTFLPLYWINVLGQSKATGGALLTMMFVTGAITTLIAGQLIDRYGVNKVLRIGWLILVPLLFFLTRITNPVFVLILVIFIAIGVFTVTTPMIVLGQKYLPGRLGLASGVTLGLGVSIGGMLSPLLGRYADANGLVAALQLLIIVPVIGSIVSLALRRPRIDNKAPASK